MHVFKFASSLLGDSRDYSRNAPAGQEGRWIKTILGKGWFANVCFWPKADMPLTLTASAPHPANLRLTQDDKMIHTLAPDRSDQPFGEAFC
jgi:hypothetical protein